MAATPISDYALVGNLRTAALVSRDGSIDWYCPPRFDAAACFAALLGEADHGRWLISPRVNARRVTRRYRDDTLVLETCFQCDQGELTLTDFMPVNGGCTLLRIVRGSRGRIPVRMECAPRFDYGRNYPSIERREGFVLSHREQSLTLHSNLLEHCDCDPSGRLLCLDFDVNAGDCYWFALVHNENGSVGESLDPLQAELDTEQWWRDWAGLCNYMGPWNDAVTRSLITIKALTYQPTGGMVAAPTTSLPEYPGGTANWDYRYCWLRDAALALDVLVGCNYMDEARAWRDWLQAATREHPGPLRTLYTIDGKLLGEESILGWLPGYEGASPVRIGNAASRQFQLDLRGELIDVLHVARERGLKPERGMWELQCRVLDHLSRCWREPDAGFWEFRDDYAHLTLSKVMAWVAFDRSILDAERYDLDAPVDDWRRIRQEIRDDVLTHGVDATTGRFVDRYGSTKLDAALLLIPIVGFLPATDSRVVNTLHAVEEQLSEDGLVYRYRNHEGSWYDKEGAFLLCSFWLVDNYWLAGDRDKARRTFERLLRLCNDVGLLAEEYDPRAQRFLGNFPQTLTHLGLINSARLLSGERVLRSG